MHVRRLAGGIRIQVHHESIGTSFEVITTAVKDYANPAGASEPGYTLMGFFTFDDLTGFRLGSSRGKGFRCAICPFVKRDDESFDTSTLSQTSWATRSSACGNSVSFAKNIKPTSTNKRSHSVSVCETEASAVSKKAKTLQAMPADASLPDGAL